MVMITTVISAMAVISATVVTAVPVPMVPGIITRPVVTVVRIGSVVGRIGSGIDWTIIPRSVIAAANPDSHANMHSGVCLAGDAQYSQQCDH